MHESEPASDLNLFSLVVFRAVAEAGSFTAGGEKCGLTQSAVTRQVQALEDRLGARLFERTTRSVRPTEAGVALLRDSTRLLADFENTLGAFRTTYSQAPLRIRVGVARSVGFSYFPGFFTAFKKNHPQVGIEFSYNHGDQILERLKRAQLDVGICCDRKRLPGGLEKTHEFQDRFVGILPPGIPDTDREARFHEGPLIGLAPDSETGRKLDQWLSDHGQKINPSMQIDSFDLMINLVSLGFGVAVVPIRALAIYGRRKPVTRLEFDPAFERKLIVVARRDRYRPDHLRDFIDQILF